MNKTSGFLAVCATLAMLSLPVFANKTYSVANETPQEPCSSDAKIAIYTEVTSNLQTDQAKAYEAAKKYVACPSEGADDAENKRVAYLKNFIAKYEKAHRKDEMTNQLAKKDYAGAFATAKTVFADDPNYLNGYMALALAGALSQNKALTADTMAYAQKSIEMIEGGATAGASWAPFENKEDALAKLNYVLGSLQGADAPDKAITHLIKAASYSNSKIKSTALTYSLLAEAYEHGPYAKLTADYEKYKGKDETPESKLLLENINQIIDREIDAYARAVALAGSDPNKAAWMATLTDLYKFRNKGADTGLNEMIAGILSKPLPPVPTPITSLPTPAATPASGTGSSATPTTGGTTTASTTTMAGSSQPKPTSTPAKPAASNPTKPRGRQAHAPRP
jgi:hypothetical protein